MDQDIAATLVTVDLDENLVDTFFTAVASAHADAAGDYEHFASILRDETGPGFAEQTAALLQHLSEHGRLDTLDQLFTNSELPGDQYRRARLESATMSDDPTPDAWTIFVEQVGPGWAGYDGSEESWTRLRDWTYTSANTQDPQLYALAWERLNPLDDIAPAERSTVLAELGFTVATATQLDVTHDAADTSWDVFVEQVGPGWAGYDGSEESWTRLRDWTYTSANTQDPQLYALAWERLGPLDNTAPVQRATALTELGFTIPTVGESGSAPPSQPVEKRLDYALKTALADMPDRNQVTPEMLERVRARLLAEQQPSQSRN